MYSHSRPFSSLTFSLVNLMAYPHPNYLSNLQLSSIVSNSVVMTDFTTVFVFNIMGIPSAIIHLHGSPITPAGVWSLVQHVFWLLLGVVQPSALSLTLPPLTILFQTPIGMILLTLPPEYTIYITHLTFPKHDTHFPIFLSSVRSQKTSFYKCDHPEAMGVTTPSSPSFTSCQFC